MPRKILKVNESKTDSLSSRNHCPEIQCIKWNFIQAPVHANTIYDRRSHLDLSPMTAMPNATRSPDLATNLSNRRLQSHES